jgi:outer membrane protein insertion porin family
MRRFSLLLMLLSISLGNFLSAQNDPTIYELGGITVKGAYLSDDKGIIALSGLAIGDKVTIPGPKVAKAIKALWKQQLFSDVQVSVTRTMGDVVFLEIEVTEVARISGWTIKGGRKKHKEDLIKILEETVPKGSSWRAHQKQTLQQIINGYFEEAGYAFAEVSITDKVSTDGTAVSLSLDINLGKKQKIHQLSFNGNANISSKKLRKQMQLKGSLLAKAKFEAATLETDKQSLLNYYHSLGYKDMSITGEKIWKDDKGRLHLTIEIAEGTQYFIGNIQWVGNSIYPTHVLEELLELKVGDAYNEPLLQQRLFYDEKGDDISSLYMNNGYLFLQIEPIEKGIEGNMIDLEIRITEGPLATISDVHIAGNTRTNEHVIRRELYTKPGQVFNRSAIIRSQRSLMAMGYFNPETLGVSTQINPENGTVALTYEVEETRNEKLELSAGWNPATEQVVGTIGINLDNFSFKNLLRGENWSPLPSGDGQTLSLRLQSTGLEYQAANFSFTEPWLGGKRPNLFTVAGFYQRFTNGVAAGSEDFTSLSVSGASVQLGTRFRLFDQVLAFTTELSAQHIDLNGYRDIVLDDGSTISNGLFNNVYLKSTLAYRTTADPFFPRKGIQSSISAQITPPFSALGANDAEAPYRWLEYHKWRFDFATFQPLSKRLVVKAGWKSGWLGALNSSLGIPPFERFELGGNGISSAQAGFVGNDILSLRGYDENYFEANQNGGGGSFLKTSVELRYEFVKTPSLRGYVLGFAEAGNIWKSASEFDPLDLNPAYGLGLRLQLPMFGTIGFDYGIGTNKPELDGQHWSKYGTFNIILGIEPD